MSEVLSIGQLARTVGLKVTTIRFYERRGLIPEPPRRESRYRIYSPETVERVRFIKRAQDLGFTLDEVIELLALQSADDASCSDVRARAKSRLDDIREKIKSLENMQRSLSRLVEQCTGGGPIPECPILNSIQPSTRR